MTSAKSALSAAATPHIIFYSDLLFNSASLFALETTRIEDGVAHIFTKCRWHCHSPFTAP